MKKIIFALMAVLCFAIPAIADDDHCYLRGDANGDDQIDPSDISALIDYLLNGVWPAEPAGEVFTVNGVSFTMIPVEGGTFTMGATKEQEDEAKNNEKPAHEVTLSSYSIGQTEVTQELWEAVMGSNPSIAGTDPQYPVEYVSWTDCLAFIAELNALTGKNFRLPTEAEWEFAARGGNLSQGYKYAGSFTLDDVAWYSGNSDDSIHMVATKAPNELGLYDMSGNVNEWCQDNYGSYSADPQTNPTGPAEGYGTRIYRGGGWNISNLIQFRVSWRGRGQDDEWGAMNNLGLRLVL